MGSVASGSDSRIFQASASLFWRRSACALWNARPHSFSSASLGSFAMSWCESFLRRNTASRASAFFRSGSDSRAMTRRMAAARSLRSSAQRLSLMSRRSRRRL